MSNLGLERFLAGRGLALHRTKVGDRYVAERMRAIGINVGGEQSGHMILSDFATTGDGLVAALQVLAVIVEQGRPASEVCRVFTPLPQLLKNVRFAGASPLRSMRDPAGDRGGRGGAERRGRLLIRESGTEPLIRVMAEGEDEALIAAWSMSCARSSQPRPRVRGARRLMRGRVLVDRRIGFRRRRGHPGGHQDHHGVRRATLPPRSPR